MFGKRSKPSQCKIGRPCGLGCVPKSHNCKGVLKGAAKTLVQWLSNVTSKGISKVKEAVRESGTKIKNFRSNLISKSEQNEQANYLSQANRTEPDKENTLKNEAKSAAIGYSKREQRTLETSHQRNLYGIAMGQGDTRDPDLVIKQDKVVAEQNKDVWQQDKIKRLLQDGLTDAEANGVVSWLDGNYNPINRMIFDAKYRDDFGEGAGIRAAQGLRKLQSFDESMVSDPTWGGIVGRWIKVKEGDMDSFLKPYRDAVGKGEFKEPTFFATSFHHNQSTEYETGGNVKYEIKPKSDGSGQGKFVDEYKGEYCDEGEVLYPPYSQFKVLSIERKENSIVFDSNYAYAQQQLPLQYRKLSLKQLMQKSNDLMQAKGILGNLVGESKMGFMKLRAIPRADRKILSSLGFKINNYRQAESAHAKFYGLFKDRRSALTVIHMEEL